MTHLLTRSLTDFCFVNLIDVTLAFEDAHSKLVVVTVAVVGDEDCVANSLLQIWNFYSYFEHFGQDFEVEVQARF